MANPLINSTCILKVIYYILDHVDDKGRWGGSDFEDWEPIITALTVELLLKAGFVPDTEWIVLESSKIKKHSLSDTCDQINIMINSSGYFGEDIWDTVRLGGIIEKYDLKERIPNYVKLKQCVVSHINAETFNETSSTWSGPGSIAATIEYVKYFDSTRAQELFNTLMSKQYADGSFHGPVNEVNDEMVHPIWHTTQVLMTALGYGLKEDDEKIHRMVNFICSTQDKSTGCWRAFSRYDVYFSSYAIMALVMLKNANKTVKDTLNKAIEWLTTQISLDGKIKDAGGTIMGALALCSVYEDQLHVKSSIADVKRMEINELLVSDYSDKIEKLTSEVLVYKEKIAIYEKKYTNADIVLSKGDVFKIGMVLTILTIIVTILVTVLPNLSKKTTQEIPQQVPQPQIIYLVPPNASPLIPEKNTIIDTLKLKPKPKQIK